MRVSIVPMAMLLSLVFACKQRSDDSLLRAEESLNAAAACGAKVGSAKIAAPCRIVDEVVVDIGNASAFQHKLDLISRAQAKIEMAYFIHTFDGSTSELNARLLERAKAGVKIRILTDGMMGLPNLRSFEALVRASELAAEQGDGKAVPIEVRFFRPIPDEVWEDLKTWGFEDRAAFGEAMAGFQVEKFGQLLLSNSFLKSSKAFRLTLAILLPGSVSQEELRTLMFDATLGRVPKVTSVEGLLSHLFAPVHAEFPDRNLKFRPVEWMRMMKRLHHKLLVVDDEAIQGGGRNLEDPYHLETDFLKKMQAGEGVDHGHPAFIDVDFHLASNDLARQAQMTFESYWNCAKNEVTRQLPKECTSRIPVLVVCPEKGFDYEPLIAASAKNRQRYGTLVASFEEGETPLHRGTFVARRAPVAYVENRMHPLRPGLAIEEYSRYNLAWVNLTNATAKGEEIIVHNAYLYFTPQIMRSLVAAVRRGVKLTVVTNSTISSPQGFVGHIAKTQFKYLMRVASEVGDPDLVRVFEYTTRHLSLHAKIQVIGDYVLVGSTNADPRSEGLDTQNGIVIGPNVEGGSVASDYKAYVAELLKRTDALKPLTKAEIESVIVNVDASTRTCPATSDKQQAFLCEVGVLVEQSAESGGLSSTLIRGFLNLVFIML